MRHHFFWYADGLYLGMRGDVKSWGLLAGGIDGLNFIEYQAHRATSIISGGLRGSKNVEKLINFFQDRNQNVIKLDKVFIKHGGFYP